MSGLNSKSRAGRPSSGLERWRPLIVAGLLGFTAGLFWPLRPSGPEPQPTSGIDPRVAWRSFSEVDLARATLETIAQEYILQAQTKIARALLDRNSASNRTPAASQRDLLEAIERLEEALAEFRGTGLEPELMRPLLLALKHAGGYDRWLELYLEAAYRFPTHPLAADFRNEALRIGQSLGRQTELERALSYLQQVPGPYLAGIYEQAPLAHLPAPASTVPAEHEPSL